MPGGGSGPYEATVASIAPGVGRSNDEGAGGLPAGGGKGVGGPGGGGTGGAGGGNGIGTGLGNGGSGEGGSGAGGGDVDGPLQFLHKVNPEYPSAARKRQKEGSVNVIVTIDEKGTLVKVDVVEATSQMFVGAVVEALKQSTYLPAYRKGLRRGSYTARFTLEQ
jgi:TonB family protein